VLPAIILEKLRYQKNSFMTRVIMFLAITIVAAPILAIGQKKTYFGVEASVTGDIYKINDNGNEIRKKPLTSGFWGFNIKQELTSNFFLETGLIRKYYYEGVNFNKISGISSTNAINAWFIPIRFGAYLNLKKNKIFIVPVIGYNFCINSDYGYGNGGGSGFVDESNGNKVTYDYISNYNLAKTFSLIQTGIGVEFKLLKTASISFYSNYYFGLKKVILLNINYSINNSTAKSAEAISKGNMTSFGVQAKYPISNFWTKSK
jgi:hypothetical protein